MDTSQKEQTNKLFKMKYLKERINRNGIRHDFLYIMLDMHQSIFSMCLQGKRDMPTDKLEILEDYLNEIEKVNKKYLI
jgi:hypothetical protein